MAQVANQASGQAMALQTALQVPCDIKVEEDITLNHVAPASPTAGHLSRSNTPKVESPDADLRRLNKKERRRRKRAVQKAANWERRRLAVLGEPKEEEELKVKEEMQTDQATLTSNDATAKSSQNNGRRRNAMKTKGKENKTDLQPEKLTASQVHANTKAREKLSRERSDLLVRISFLQIDKEAALESLRAKEAHIKIEDQEDHDLLGIEDRLQSVDQVKEELSRLNKEMSIARRRAKRIRRRLIRLRRAWRRHNAFVKIEEAGERQAMVIRVRERQNRERDARAHKRLLMHGQVDK